MTSQYFKNPARTLQKPYKPYTPQWQVLDKEPMTPEGQPLSELTARPAPVVVPPSNLRPVASFGGQTRKPRPMGISQNVPFAEPGQTLGSGHPNVGNNVEATWASLDGMSINEQGDVVEIEDAPVQDNNVDDPRNYKSIPKMLPPPAADNQMYLDVKVDEGVLVVMGEVIAINPLSLIEEEVQALIFGEHPLCQDNDITLDDIVVLKRAKIRAGVFVE